MIKMRDQIENLNQELHINQRSFLLDKVVKAWPQLSEESKTRLWNNTEFLTEGKYKYLLALYYNRSKPGQDGWLASEKLWREIKQLIQL